MISEMQTPQKNSQQSDLFVAEFGIISYRDVDSAKNYHGKIYRMSPDLLKSLTDALGFAARFELPTIRTAYIDVHGTEGTVNFEIERNTKPTDISIRYTRDRWNLQDATGKGPGSANANSEGLRSWIRSEYRARFLDNRLLASIADQLKIKLADLPNFFIRLNLKERTFGLIVEEHFADQFPTDAFSWFSLAAAQLPAISSEAMATAEATEATTVQHFPKQSSIKEATISDTAPNKGATSMNSQINADEKQNIEALAEQISSDQLAMSASNEDGVSQPLAAAASQATVQSSTMEVPTATTANAQLQPEQEQAATKKHDSKDEDNFFTKPKASTKSPEPERQEASSRRSDSSYTRPESSAARSGNIAEATPEPLRHTSSSSYARRDSSSEGQAKYATYSRSEVDYLLKQQAEQILSALSGKVASQQRSFQEAIASQEKTFTKISDNFLTQFDDARIKLEATTKTAQENTHRELNEFHKQLTKELEQHRTQINKVVIPVSKALEDPSKFKQLPKEQKQEPQPKAAAVNANITGLQRLIKVTLAVAAISLIVSIMNLLSILSQSNQINTKPTQSSLGTTGNNDSITHTTDKPAGNR